MSCSSKKALAPARRQPVGLLRWRGWNLGGASPLFNHDGAYNAPCAIREQGRNVIIALLAPPARYPSTSAARIATESQPRANIENDCNIMHSPQNYGLW